MEWEIEINVKKVFKYEVLCKYLLYSAISKGQVTGLISLGVPTERTINYKYICAFRRTPPLKVSLGVPLRPINMRTRSPNFSQSYYSISSFVRIYPSLRIHTIE